MDNLNSSQKEYFHQAYQTGTDTWGDNTYTEEILDFIRMLPHKGFVLDLGSGRGEWSFLMADIGMKVIGLDYIEELTEKNNEKVRERGYAGRVAFMAGDVFDIPLKEETFDSVVDIGTLQHIHPKDWERYEGEVFRVLKPGGFILLVELSRQTEQFLNWKPNQETTGNFENHGLTYHFFDKKEIEEVFGNNFKIIKSEIHTFPEMENRRYIFTLLQKKK